MSVLLTTQFVIICHDSNRKRYKSRDSFRNLLSTMNVAKSILTWRSYTLRVWLGNQVIVEEPSLVE